MKQAIGVVVLSSLAAGIGTMSQGRNRAAGARHGGGPHRLVYLGLSDLCDRDEDASGAADQGGPWRTASDPRIRQRARPAPGIGLLPAVSGIVLIGSSIWMLIAMVVAVRQALDYQSTLRAVGVCVVGWVIQIAVLIFVMVVGGGVASQTGPTP